MTTIERLGIAPSVDLLLTSAGEGASKSDGLFVKALQRVGCEVDELLHVGDSLDRDIAPTSALDIANVYVGEEEPPEETTTIRVDLARLAELLEQLPGNDEGSRV
jgi:FMN phosphatase YigB (HAD superfamily)